MSDYIKKIIPFEHSFASSEKAQFWSKENELSPEQVYLNSHKEYKFDCNICNHIFKIRLDRIKKVNFVHTAQAKNYVEIQIVNHAKKNLLPCIQKVIVFPKKII